MITDLYIDPDDPCVSVVSSVKIQSIAHVEEYLRRHEGIWLRKPKSLYLQPESFYKIQVQNDIDISIDFLKLPIIGSLRKSIEMSISFTTLG